MSYQPMGQSGGPAGPMPEKTVGWLWGFLIGVPVGAAAAAIWHWWL